MQFPKLIHVVKENEGGEDEFYSVFTESAESALTETKKTQVATYELKAVKEGKLEPVFSAEIG
jgi:hypothetical protein